MQQAFTKFSKLTARITGHPITFIIAITIVIIWALTGPIFGFSDTWQLVINTGTTIITFLMVFLIQNTQNKDTMAVQLKLDELLRAVKGAHVSFLDLEEMTDEDLEGIKVHYEDLAKRARDKLNHGKPDTDVPHLKAQVLKKAEEEAETTAERTAARVAKEQVAKQHTSSHS